MKFYVSLADSSLLAIDRLGAYLSVGPVGPIGNYAPLALTPQVESPANAYLTNAAGWTLVGGSPGGPGTTCTPNPCEPTVTHPKTWGQVKAIYR